jgi:hypothetical protein
MKNKLVNSKFRINGLGEHPVFPDNSEIHVLPLERDTCYCVTCGFVANSAAVIV